MSGVKAAIWRNDTDAGPRYNVTFERLYRDGKEWKTTSSFGRDDLLILSKVADRAHTWILEVKAESKSADRLRDGGDGDSDRLTSASMPRRK